MGKVHIITQYIWPDGSPVCLISEQLAKYLDNQGIDVVMVGGSGEYRPSLREKPKINLVKLKSKAFKRDNSFQILYEYLSVYRKFKNYINNYVDSGDTVIISSAPFLNAMLIKSLSKKSVHSIFWLFDYFPASIFNLKMPNFVFKYIRQWWDTNLEKYNHVIKISSNLGYHKNNAVIFRQWPMIPVEPNPSVEVSKKAIYTGNLGLAHDVDSLIKECEKLRDLGYEVNFYADGPGLEKLPPWLKARSNGVFKNQEDLIKALLEHEIHLITGTPGTEELSFPSKTWNSIAAGKKIIATGFSGQMKNELELSIKSDYKQHLPSLARFIMDISEKRLIN